MAWSRVQTYFLLWNNVKCIYVCILVTNKTLSGRQIKTGEDFWRLEGHRSSGEEYSK